MAGNTYGGKITLRLSSGAVFALRGTFNIMPAKVSNDGVTNQDGSLDRIATPKSPGFEITFADKGLDYSALMESDRFNATFDEEHTGVSHLYTGAFMVGDPNINRLTGEVTGLTGMSESYNRVGG